MSLQFDEFSKSLSEETLPRRESLRRLGAVFAGALFGSLGLKSASAAPKADPCKTFCKCRNKSQQSQCIEACRACNEIGGCLSGYCGNYYCADLENDVFNCGACGYECDAPGPYELRACIAGKCEYTCWSTVYGDAVHCDGICTFLGYDPDNCGACGHVCDESKPYCSSGQCWDANCGGADLNWDSNNCGVCGYVCPWGTACSFGVCHGNSDGN
jgi:hypothetical protein